MSGHTPHSLPIHGEVPLEARKVWERVAKDRDHAGFCLLPVGPLIRTGPLPLKDLPGCFQRPVCKHSLWLAAAPSQREARYSCNAQSAPKPR